MASLSIGLLLSHSSVTGSRRLSVRQTLPKSIILRGYQSFSNVISNGTSIQGALLTGYVTSRSGGSPAAIVGFTVSKRRVPLAVHRNRIKRLMREAVRKNFCEIQDAAAAKTRHVEVVLSYKGKKEVDVRRLSLHNIEPDWDVIKQGILEKV